MKGGLNSGSSPPSKGKIVDPINNDSKGFSFAFVNNALKPFFFPASVAAAVAFVVAKSAPPPLAAKDPKSLAALCCAKELVPA